MKLLVLVTALTFLAAPALGLGSAIELDSDRLAMPDLPAFPELAGTNEGLAIPHNLGPMTEEFAERSQALPVPAIVLFNGDAFLVQTKSGNTLAIPNFANAGETRVDEEYVYPAEFGAWGADLQNDVTQALRIVDTASRQSDLVPHTRVGFNPTTVVPELAFDFDLAEGDLNACALECAAAPGDVAALLGQLAGQAGFTRAAGFHGAQPASFREVLAAPAFDPGFSPASSVAAEPRAGAPVQTQDAGILAALPADSAALLAAAAVAVGLLLALPLALYSKIRRDMTLVNDTRRAVFEAVVSNPGLSIQEVARRADISHSTAAYHLDRLAGAGLVVATGDGNKVRYYRNGGRFTEQERKLLPCLENTETVRVLEAVLHRPWTYRAEVAQALGVTATTVNWHLKRLFGAGMLSEAREGRSAYLFVDRAALAQACQGLHEKVPDSPAREAAARILAQLGPQLPATALPERPRSQGPTLVQAVAASVAVVPQPVPSVAPAHVSTSFTP